MLSPSRLVGLALLFLALPAGARTLEVGPGKQFAQPSERQRRRRMGKQCGDRAGAVLRLCGLATEQSDSRGSVGQDTAITDTTCQGKALFVMPGSNVTVRNLTLTRARVPDGNGAGIRAEGRNLVVERVRFIDNQNGNLAADQPQGAITVRDSEFVRNGTCEQACAHGIYVGRLALLRVERSTFREMRQGHYGKTPCLSNRGFGPAT